MRYRLRKTSCSKNAALSSSFSTSIDNLCGNTKIA
jgi:hypothetical protein